ncbi:phage holin family protein [Flavobacteriaceae bacterium F08102]|nr:phage holin family protein [Flavobacteriaceae bacterium F08102]
MNLVIKMLITAIAVLLLAEILPGVEVQSFMSAVWVAIVLAFLRVFAKPLIILFTLPLTILTLGLFLFVINACIILLADTLVSGFEVNGFWWALFFSLFLSGIQSWAFSLVRDKKQNLS